MFFNNTKAMNKAKKYIKAEEEKKKRRTKSMDETTNETSNLPSESTDSRQSVRSAPSIIKVQHSRSSTSATMNSRSGAAADKVSYAEHKANKALESIQLTIESQEMREGQLENEIRDSMITAKNKLAGGQKRAALRTIKKVKLEQVELDKVSRVIETLEAQKLQIESSLNTIQVLKVMQEGSTTLQNLNSNSKVEDIDVVVDEIRDTMLITAEINEILSEPVDNILVDDDELLKELEEYGNENDNNAIAANANAVDLPEVPTKALPPVSQAAETHNKNTWLNQFVGSPS